MVYGATPSGIMAAIAVKKAGKSVVIVEQSKWVGGILGAGIKPIEDCPNFEAVGGATKQAMKILGVRNPTKEITEDYLNELSRTTMSPKDIRDDFKAMLKQNNIEVIFQHRVSNCKTEKNAIGTAIFDQCDFDELGCPIAEPIETNALFISAKVFIDASYEGELMAKSSVSFTFGRESFSDYNEARAGKNPLTNITPISPFINPKNPNSGILPLIEPNEASDIIGSGDHFTQAYNYRFYITSIDSLKAPFGKSDSYDPIQFELVIRYIEFLTKNNSGDILLRKLRMIFPGWPNDRDYNYQRNSLITIAPLNISQIYVNGDYHVKSAIWKQHQNYLRDLHHFLSTDPRVPSDYQKYVRSLGLDKQHHPETGGWPNQLYIRVSRRLVGNYKITDRDVYNKKIWLIRFALHNMELILIHRAVYGLNVAIAHLLLQKEICL